MSDASANEMMEMLPASAWRKIRGQGRTTAPTRDAILTLLGEVGPLPVSSLVSRLPEYSSASVKETVRVLSVRGDGPVIRVARGVYGLRGKADQ